MRGYFGSHRVEFSRCYFGFYHILLSRGATLDKKLSGYKKGSIVCMNLSEGLLWISINSQSYKWGATLDLVKIEILESRGYFGLGGGLLWRKATLDRSSLTVQTVYDGSINSTILKHFSFLFKF